MLLKNADNLLIERYRIVGIYYWNHFPFSTNLILCVLRVTARGALRQYESAYSLVLVVDSPKVAG